MKKTLKEEMLEAITVTQCKELEWITNDDIAISCTSIAEKHIKIARLEGMIEGFKIGFHPQGSDKYNEVIGKLEQELKELKKQ